MSALLVTLFNFYTSHHFDSPDEIAVRFGIFMALGSLWGNSVWKRREALGHKKLTRTGNIVRGVLFLSLMLGLTYALWTMTRH